jgi:hypothetical protein
MNESLRGCIGMGTVSAVVTLVLFLSVCMRRVSVSDCDHCRIECVRTVRT